jgi:hypothetical protein
MAPTIADGRIAGIGDIFVGFVSVFMMNLLLSV